MNDIFRPKSEPHRAIYDAFQDEAANRKGRPVNVWTEAELKAVERAASLAAVNPQFKLAPPTRTMVERAERYARGSADYGRTWVCTLLRMMSEAFRDTDPKGAA